MFSKFTAKTIDLNLSPKKELYLKVLGWIIFCLIVYIPVFQDINRMPLQFWDESRNANNAIEMAENGNYLIRYYNGSPDMWELNPPLLTWLQSTSMKVFGYNEFALRFPICLATLSTIFLIIYFFKKEFDQFWPGILATMVLITSPGYIDHHITRTGDHDALLIFFLTGFSLNYFRHLKHYANTSRYLIYATIFIILSVYTKSIAGLFALPGIFIYTLYKGKLKTIFGDYRTYVSFLIFSGVVISYYLIREHYNPGYLNNVWNDQLFPRFTDVSSNHDYNNGGMWDYFNQLFKWQFMFWIPALLLPVIFKNKLKELGYWDIVIFSFIVPLILLIILSVGTKNIWYDGPVFPFLSIICGIGLFIGGRKILDSIELNENRKMLFSLLLILLIFYTPYSFIFDKVYKNNEKDQKLYNGLFIRQLKKENKNYYNYSMFFQGYNAPVEFYAKALNTYDEYNIRVIGDQVQEIHVFDTIMSCDTAANQILFESFHLKTIERFKHCRLFVIDGLKETN